MSDALDALGDELAKSLFMGERLKKGRGMPRPFGYAGTLIKPSCGKAQR
jgi:hypothetical protein